MMDLHASLSTESNLHNLFTRLFCYHKNLFICLLPSIWFLLLENSKGKVLLRGECRACVCM